MNSSWSLTPSAVRPLSKLTPIVEKIRAYKGGITESLPERNFEQALIVEAYIAVMRRFLLLARELSFPVGEAPESDAVQAGVLAGYPPSSLPYDIIDTWRHVSLIHNHPSVSIAQHHQVPTFLLDWTEDPIIAAHFASVSEANTLDEDLAIWAFNKKYVANSGLFQKDLGLPKLNIIHPETTTNEFLAAQKGTFTYFTDPGRWDIENETFPSIEEVVSKSNVEQVEKWWQSPNRKRHENPLIEQELAKDLPRIKSIMSEIAKKGPYLKKIVLRKSERSHLRELLKREGISQAHLMPTLDNVALTSYQFLL